MLLFNKLIWTDIVMGIAVILSFITEAGWQGFFEGIALVCFLFSLFNHIRHFKETKKLY